MEERSMHRNYASIYASVPFKSKSRGQRHRLLKVVITLFFFSVFVVAINLSTSPVRSSKTVLEVDMTSGKNDMRTSLPTTKKISHPPQQSVHNAKELSFVLSTKYTERGDAQVYSTYVWASGPIVEPYLPTKLTVKEPINGNSYQWIWQGKTYAGAALEVHATEVGTFPVTLMESGPNGDKLRLLQTSLVVKYVRREIRQLTDEDREAFFNTMEYLLVTPDHVGKEVYGDQYRPMSYFVGLHLYGSGDSCDHLHEGVGFLNNHIGITLALEQALQVVNPAVTMPYWDFTVDAHEVMTKFDGNFNSVWKASDLFKDDWFGNYNDVTNTLDEGRWGGLLKVETDQWDAPLHNAYGMMRAPWSTSNCPLTQRFRQVAGTSVFGGFFGWPTCDSHYSFLQKSMAYDLTTFMHESGNSPHSPMHTILGGTVDLTNTFDRLETFMDPADVGTMRARSFHIPKTLWRIGFLSCPTNCDLETTPKEECVCSCGSSEELRRKLSNDETLMQAWYGATAGLKGDDYTKEEKKKFLEAICGLDLLGGDQLEAASPLDLIFWPLHPTIERLVMWSWMNGAMAGDQHWPSPEEAYWGDTPPGAEPVCDGHGEFDVLMWSLDMDDGSPGLKKTYTNWEMYTMSNPATVEYSLPYVYADFIWNHCMDEGFDFDQF